ncbi:Transcriptional regulatory protein [Yarrowia sp. C11]|nr:Transcriptional regulatory protein [Yarrowia sp. C11]
MAQPKKSRAGCITCKRRRSKCDETKPGCLECQKRGLTCEGYATSFKWKSFKGMPKDAAPNEKPHKQDFEYHGRTPVTQKATADVKFEPATFISHNSTSDVMFAPYHNYAVSTKKRGSESTDNGGDVAVKRRVMSEGAVTVAPASAPANTSRHHSVDVRGTGNANGVNGVNGQFAFNGVKPEPIQVNLAPAAMVIQKQDQIQTQPIVQAVLDPIGQQSLGPPFQGQSQLSIQLQQAQLQNQIHVSSGKSQHHPNHTLQHLQQSHVNLSHLQQQSHLQSNQHLCQNPLQLSQNHNALVTPNAPDSSSYAYASVPLPIDDYYTRISRLFDHHTCGIVTIKDGPSDNPWRTSLWPLAQHNPVLYHAIAAMTLFHTARGNIEVRREAFTHMRDSIQLLASGISTLQPHVALATTLSLAFAESWDQHITTGMLHLRGSKPLVKGLLAKYNRRLPSWLLFLYNSFVYLDVLARLTSSGVPDDDDVLEVGDPHMSRAGEDPLGIAPVISADLFHLQQQLPDLSTSPPPVIRPHARDMHPPGAADGIDPLLGCAQTLFPVIGKIGTLANRVARFESDSTTVSQAAVLMRLLQQWRPATAVQYFVNDPDWDLKSCLNTAEAYRYAAMIHLVQAVPQVQNEPLPVVTQRILQLLEEIPTSSRTCTTHIFPLLVAGCEAQGAQRQFVRQRWESLAVRLWIGNVDRAVEVMEEVWRQRDRMGWKGEPVGVTSPAYWSQVMKNWRWEVLLG